MGEGRFSLEWTPEAFGRAILRGEPELAELGRNLLKYCLVTVKNRFSMFLVIVHISMFRWKMARDPVHPSREIYQALSNTALGDSPLRVGLSRVSSM